MIPFTNEDYDAQEMARRYHERELRRYRRQVRIRRVLIVLIALGLIALYFQRAEAQTQQVYQNEILILISPVQWVNYYAATDTLFLNPVDSVLVENPVYRIYARNSQSPSPAIFIASTTSDTQVVLLDSLGEGFWEFGYTPSAQNATVSSDFHWSKDNGTGAWDIQYFPECAIVRRPRKGTHIGIIIRKPPS